ncbi:MAG: hypothetical protein V7L01_34740 [Nostoc sp.]|uniref:hypothetical protein n=1 Tax=Nostoc sp. TaxID=1180 RepID=UPI002FF9B5DF
MTLKNTFGEYSFVTKLDVTNLEASAEWYKSKLGLVPEENMTHLTGDSLVFLIFHALQSD